MSKYEFLNTGKAVKLESLVKSEDITDEYVIQIFDQNGQFITKGNWFQDNILEYTNAVGIATKSGTGHTVSFKIANETDDSTAIVLEKLAETMKYDAFEAAYRMNEQADKKDLARNHVNYGVMRQALRYLRELGYDAMDATWGDGDFLICEKITINGKVVFKR